MIQFCIGVIVLAGILTFIFRDALEYSEDKEDDIPKADGKS